MTKAVEIVSASKRYGDVLAVDDVSFDVTEGECISLLGPSGCGKTTTLRLIAGFETLDEGAVRINGQDMRGRRPYERSIGLVFQDYALFPHMTVAQNIAYGMRRRGFDHREIAPRISDLLKLVKLSGVENRRPAQLSGGEQQRIALARALAIRPEVLLLDEPLSNLDAKLREHVREELRDILSLTRVTTIIVTHDQQEAMSLSDNVVVMSKGKVMQQGSPAAIYSKASNRFVADFIGSMNWLRAERRGKHDLGLAQYVTREGQPIVAPDVEVDGQGPFDIGIRPERIELAEGRPSGGGEAANLLPGTVSKVTFLGGDIHLIVTTKAGIDISIMRKNTRSTLASVGQAVTLSLDPEDCIVLPAND
jgi:ABC-type Fe3+/spermidine/putrescine transport system ATPase subunit